jgi:NADPH-dependent 2,4-dienoyl-CoA reductase/sulfur reductase-like enzyme
MTEHGNIASRAVDPRTVDPRTVGSYDVLVCGAGPAGIAAAEAAGKAGARVGLIDAQFRPGGQLWRAEVGADAPRPIPAPVDRVLRRAGIEFWARTQIVAAIPGELLVHRASGAERVGYRKLVIATGARELLLPFPGWTLPGVFGAGGLQALVKQGWPIAGKRVVVAGSGPLLLAAAASLRRHGAIVLGIHEQAPAGRVRGLAARLPAWPDRALQAARLRGSLAGVPYRCGEFVTAAAAAVVASEETLASIELHTPDGPRRVACDYLAIGYGLVPNVEVAELLGCKLETEGRHPRVAVDAHMRTSVDTVYAAGEVCGIGGAAAARLEGTLAGRAAAGAHPLPASLRLRRRHARNFGRLLARRFALDERIRALPASDTVICRCEDVPLAALAGFTDARAAKLATRCGMGACQGRWSGARLPLYPLPLAGLCDPFSTPGNPR